MGVGEKAYKVLHGNLTGLINTFHEFQDKVSVTVNDGYADVVVIFVLVGVNNSTQVEGVTYRVRVLFYF